MGICSALCTEKIVTPPTEAVGRAAEMKAELRGEDLKGADAGRTIAGVLCSVFPLVGSLPRGVAVTMAMEVPGSH